MPTTPPELIDAGAIELRRRTAADDDRMLAAVTASRAHLLPWMPWAAAEPTIEATREVGAEAMRQWAAGEDFVVTMYETQTGELVGGAGLHRRVGPGALEIGYWVRVDRTGRGYATAAADALTRVAFTLDGIDRVEIHCDQANAASAAVPRRLGYRLDRIEQDQIRAPGETGQGMVWVLDRPDHS